MFSLDTSIQKIIHCADQETSRGTSLGKISCTNFLFALWRFRVLEEVFLLLLPKFLVVHGPWRGYLWLLQSAVVCRNVIDLCNGSRNEFTSWSRIENLEVLLSSFLSKGYGRIKKVHKATDWSLNTYFELARLWRSNSSPLGSYKWRL